MNKIAIYGNTPAAWVAAVFLKARLKIEVLLLTPPLSSEQLSVSTAESFSPELIKIHALCGLDERQYLQASGAYYQLAMRITGQSKFKKECDAMLPFADIGASFDGLDFHHYATKANIVDFEAYSLACLMARETKFVHPVAKQNSVLSTFNYGMALDSVEYTRLMVKYAQHLGVKVLACSLLKEKQIVLRDNKIDNIRLADGQAIEADFFLDASDELSLYQTQYKAVCDNTDGLSLDQDTSAKPAHSYNRRVIAKLHKNSDKHSNTQATLYKDIANTEVGLYLSQALPQGMYYQVLYDDRAQSIEDVKACLARLSALKMSDLALRDEAINLHAYDFTWSGNCLAISNTLLNRAPSAYGNIELTIRAIKRFIDIAPVSANMAHNAKEYNRLTQAFNQRIGEYQQAFDFLLTHNGVQQKLEHLPKPLENKLRLFRERGYLTQYENDPLPPYMWINLFLCTGYLPHSYSALLDMKDSAQTFERIDYMKHFLKQTLSQLPQANQYIQHLLSSLKKS